MKYSFTLLLSLLISIYSQTTLTAKVVGIKYGETVLVLDSLNHQTTLRLAARLPRKKPTIRHKSKTIHIKPNISKNNKICSNRYRYIWSFNSYDIL